MIAAKLIIQTVLGLGAVASVAGGSYMLMGSSDENNFFVFVVSSVATSTQPADDLYTETTDTKKETKNFKCQITGATDTASEDETCEIFSLPEFNASNKSIKYAELQSANTKVTKKASLTTDKYFKLKINKTKMSALKWNVAPEKTIDLVSTKASETNKKYATLKPLIKQENNKLQGKTQFIVGKVFEKAQPDLTGTLSFKCTVGTTNTSTDCDVYKFTTQPTNGKDHNELNFSATSTPTTWAEITNNNYYLIDLKNNKYDVSSNETTTIVVTGTANSTTSTFKLKTSSPLIGSVTSTTANNKVIFLK